jgi:hypothetical protein
MQGTLGEELQICARKEADTGAGSAPPNVKGVMVGGQGEEHRAHGSGGRI